ncbi:MAG TPA: hypothetical protein VHN80_29875 [Kineosporiaceae bacterium]|nr:hypothetical protein [Kineosporiaceae bacterium]
MLDQPASLPLPDPLPSVRSRWNVSRGWGQRLAHGHGQVVRQVLANATTPVLLLPREPAAAAGSTAPQKQRVVDRWGEPVEILLVEDDPAHTRLTQEAFDEIGLVNALQAVDSGEAALAFLSRQPPHVDAPALGLILMDVHLPGQRPRRAGRDQGRPGPAGDSRRRTHLIHRERRRGRGLRTRRHLLYHQAGAVRRVRGHRARARPILVHHRHPRQRFQSVEHRHREVE